MADVEITIRLPEALVERAKALGLDIEGQTKIIAEAVEHEISQRESGKRREIAAGPMNDSQLAAMANDPDIQREIGLIQEEFAVTDSDGLSRHN